MKTSLYLILSILGNAQSQIYLAKDPYLTKDALLNRCKQFSISDEDCMNSTYLPQKEYNAYLKSFNVPIIKDDYCNEGKCIAVIYKDGNRCIHCTDRNCMNECKKVVHTDYQDMGGTQPPPVIPSVGQQVGQVPPSTQNLPNSQSLHQDVCSTCNIITITKELTRTIDIPKITTKTDTITSSPSINVITSILVSSIPKTSILTVTETDLSTIRKTSTTTSIITSKVKAPITTSKVKAPKTVTITKEDSSSDTVKDIDDDHATSLFIPTTTPTTPTTPSQGYSSRSIPSSSNIITVTREIPTTVTVDRPLTLYREVTTTYTSEVPIVNYKVTTFTKKFISTIEKSTTITTTEKSYITESVPLTSFITSFITSFSTVTSVITSQPTPISGSLPNSSSISQNQPKEPSKYPTKDKDKDPTKDKDPISFIDQQIDKKNKEESAIPPSVRIETRYETIVSTVTKEPSSTVTKELVSTITKEPVYRTKTVVETRTQVDLSVVPPTTTISKEINTKTVDCPVEKDKEDDLNVDKLIPLLKELLTKEEKHTKKKKKKHKAITNNSLSVNPQTAVELKKPKTIVHTIYSRRKKPRCIKKKTKCVDCDSTCEESSEIFQTIFNKKK